MNNITRIRKNAPALVLFALAVVFAAPVISAAQGRGNGKGQGGNFDKCAKFVNCHDARDGRVDGRGPAVNPNVSPVYQPQQPVVYPNQGNYPVQRYPNNGSSNQVYYPRARHRRVNRVDNSDNNTTANNQSGTWRHRRHNSNDTETRSRRTHRRDRTNVTD